MKQEVTAGILHIGVGNFHRAHEEYLTCKLMEKDPSQSVWGICGAMLLQSDERLYKALKSQNCKYTLTVCGRDGHDEFYTIDSLVDLIWGCENPEAVLDKIADPAIKIITLTITEGGYNISKKDGRFVLEDTNVAHDLVDPGNPRTVFGYVAEGLRRRRDKGSGPVTIQSCDNLQHNGDTARKSFTAFFTAQDAGLADWVESNVTFPNSMVDRITPATRPEDIERLNAKNGTHDAAPVYCEDFIQWVIEDKFIAGRPAWEEVGAQFSDNVKAWENMKLSLLNASHTLLSYPSFLAGYRKVDEAMRDGRIRTLLKDFMDKDITPYVPAPDGTDLELYKKTLLERFANRTVSDQIARLCSDGASKFPVYVTPNLGKMVRDNADLTRPAFLLACYRHYLKYRKDDKGAAFEINDPWLTEDDFRLVRSDNPLDFLAASPFASTNLAASRQFVSKYGKMAESILSQGTMNTLESII